MVRRVGTKTRLAKREEVRQLHSGRFDASSFRWCALGEGPAVSTLREGGGLKPPPLSRVKFRRFDAATLRCLAMKLKLKLTVGADVGREN